MKRNKSAKLLIRDINLMICHKLTLTHATVAFNG
jgi:hypothetical protein